MGLSFNGVEITDIVPFDTLNVSAPAPSVSVTTVRPALGNRALSVRREYGTRVISITGDIKEEHINRRQEWITALRSWASSPVPAPLVIPQEERGYLMALCTSLPDATARDWWEDISIIFTVDDPLYMANEELTAALPGPVPVFETESPSFRIEQEIASPLTDPAWYCGGKVMSLAGEVPVGHLVIDFYEGTVTIDGVYWGELSMNSRYWSLEPGVNIVTCANGAGGTLFRRERWL